MDMILRIFVLVALALVVCVPFWYATRKKPSHRDRDHNLSPPQVSSGSDSEVNTQAFIHH